MPRETLTREQIIRTAIELLDEEGLEGLNMRALGKRLGTAATAVYWHVKNKDDLVRLVGDRVWDEVELPDLDAVDWRTAATRMATGLHEMLSRHPWLVQAFGTYLFHGPGKARHDDHSLAVYEAAGFAGPAADRAAAATFTFVLGNVLGASAAISLTRRLGRDGGDETPGAACKAAPEGTFDYGLGALLNGVQAELAAGTGDSGTR
ncbi:TetR/AcrR family transcriptional regulator [Streptomyces sp. NBC_01565]|uniref:TetR/AcrR family transcriptional regulator n=1 Tax=unclassified Streptomyces TaxID=2593676 RepID=UPI0022598116|nr:TetR/AcrR family transcriptional regulator [Streptomyces sp. NBC_01565]MCX4545705.1 TetR/AcrR family transcriptional regulator C-terminal domain-containing protein [Streptomyces sp. NBC_01565]